MERVLHDGTILSKVAHGCVENGNVMSYSVVMADLINTIVGLQSSMSHKYVLGLHIVVFCCDLV